MNKDLIPVIAIGGALGIIVFLSSKNQNKADEVYMPYGWGSFNNSNNPLQPINITPTPTPTQPRKITLPYFKKPIAVPSKPITPKIPPPVLSPGYSVIEFPFHKNPYIEPQPPPAPMGFTTYPMVSKPTVSFKALSPTAVRDTVKPVTGKKVI